MNVLHTVNSISRMAGGLFHSVRSVCRESALQGEAVRIMAIEDQYSRADGKHWAPVVPECFAPSGPRQLGFSLGLRKAISGADVDILHTHGHWQYVSWAALRWKRRFGRPHVCSPHGMLQPWALRHRMWKKKPMWLLLERENVRTAKLLHATSLAEARALRDLGCSQPIAVIPNAVTLPSLSSQATRNDTQRTALFLGRISPVKGLLNLVEAWKQVAPPGWRMIVCGPDDREHRAAVIAAAAQHGVDKCFEFKDAVYGSEKDRLLAEADLFILPSFSENFCLSVAEALAAGLPVITTKAAPWREIVLHQCGWWIDVGTPELVKALKEATLLSLDSLRDMGARARRLMETRPGWAELTLQMRQVYSWILGFGPRPGCVREFGDDLPGPAITSAIPNELRNV